MIRRKGIPDGGCSMCCRLKQKLDELWQRTSGCILRIRGITPDGQGDFALEAGQNVNISEVPNGLKISTTGGVSYYEPADAYVEIDNDTLEIGVKAGVQDGLATQNDLETVASAVTNIIDGTTQVADAAHADSADSATSATNATNAQYLGSSSSNVGNDTKPIKIVNGVATVVTKDLTVNESYTATATINTSYLSGGSVFLTIFGKIAIITLQGVELINTGSGVECITLPNNLRIRGQASIPIIQWGSDKTYGLMSTTNTGIAFWINQTTVPGESIWESIVVILE